MNLNSTSGLARHSTTSSELVDEVFKFHGHLCPGGALGIRVSEVALAAVGHHSKKTPVVALVESSLCEVDAIQYLTGCTLGKRNLIHRDHGKRIYTFWRRSEASGIRIVSKVETPADLYAVHQRIHDGVATPDEVQAFEQIQVTRREHVMQAPVDELFDVEIFGQGAPSETRLVEHVPCQSCGDRTAVTHLHDVGDEMVCPVCAAQLAAGVTQA